MAAEIDVQPMRDISAPLELRKAAFGDIKTAPATSFSIAFIAIVLFMAALAIWATRGLRFRPTATPTSRSFMPIGQLVVERNFFGQSLRSLSLDWRKAMIEPGHPRHSIVRQCELASISRSSFYRGPTVENEATLKLMRLIDEQFLETPWYGSRQVARHLLQRLVRWSPPGSSADGQDGSDADLSASKTSEPHPRHKIHPYLLRLGKLII